MCQQKTHSTILNIEASLAFPEPNKSLNEAIENDE